MVYAVAFRFVRNAEDAEDITQEVFIRVWRNLHSYRPEQGQLSTWLYRITTNCCLDFERSLPRNAGKGFRDLNTIQQWRTQDDADRHVDSEEFNSWVIMAAQTLPPKQRMVFILRDMEGLTPEEVGGAIGMSAGQIKSNLFHARQKISTVLKIVFQIK